MLHLCCLCARASAVLGRACQSSTTTLQWAWGPLGRGVLRGATRYRTCGPTGARYMAAVARTLSSLLFRSRSATPVAKEVV